MKKASHKKHTKKAVRTVFLKPLGFVVKTSNIKIQIKPFPIVRYSGRRSKGILKMLSINDRFTIRKILIK